MSETAAMVTQAHTGGGRAGEGAAPAQPPDIVGACTNV